MASLFSLALAQDNMVRGKYINAQTGTTYTLGLDDAGAIVTLTNAGAIALTVPTNADAAFATNSIIILIAGGAGVVTVAGDTGVTVNSANSDATLAQNDWGILVKTGTDTWQFTVLGGTGGGGGGAVAQMVNTTYTTSGTGTTTIPLDNTIPQNTEGTEFFTLSITPTSATNKLRIDVLVYCTTTTANRWPTVALFQDSVADALAAGVTYIEIATEVVPLQLTHWMTAGTTSATTFKVRAGLDAAGTIQLNGRNGAALYGGVFASSITITEIVP